jgi:ABC-type uncharacterized transport system ATPase subunit
MAEPLLQVQNLRKSYGALRVTDDITLDVLPGELHAIIGPNGAGKTTLIHQLSGMAASDGGAIRFDGSDIMRLSMPERVRLGWRAPSRSPRSSPASPCWRTPRLPCRPAPARASASSATRPARTR